MLSIFRRHIESQTCDTQVKSRRILSTYLDRDIPIAIVLMSVSGFWRLTRLIGLSVG